MTAPTIRTEVRRGVRKDAVRTDVGLRGAARVLARLVAWGAIGVLVLGGAECGEARDTIELSRGRTLRGYLRRGVPESTINTFGCSLPEMTLGVRRVLDRNIESVTPADADEPFWRALEELGPRDAARRLELLREAVRAKAKLATHRLAVELVRLEPAHAGEAERYVPKWGAKAERAAGEGDLRWDLTLQRRVRDMLRLQSAAARREAALALQAATRWSAEAAWVERAARVMRAPRGIRLGLQPQLVDERLEGATYSLFVPEDLDPLEPRPVVIALHGGGIRGTKGTPVRGRGRELLPVLLDTAQALGWIVICPTAIEAPWGTPLNGRWIEELLAEVGTQWPLDLERVHLLGVGGGANGAWFHGARMARSLASVGAASGDAPTRVSTITGARTGLWFFHGARDDITPVEPVRKAAERLVGKATDFVYCELPQEGHGLPPLALRDWAQYVLPKRRPRVRTPWPRDSLREPPTARELERLGEPGAAWKHAAMGALGNEELLRALASGRREAEAAGAVLAARSGEAGELTPKLMAIVRDRDSDTEARRLAAEVLGGWQAAEALPVLGDALRAKPEPALALALVRALGALGSQDAVEDLRFALLALGRRWRGLGGQGVSYVAFDATVREACALIEALGRCRAPEELLPSMEETLVLGILRDRREILHRPDLGEDPRARRAELLEACARTYRTLEAPRTLTDMLVSLAKKDPVLLAAIQRGASRPWKR